MTHREAPTCTRLDSIPATPWRNGKGFTRELLAWPSTQAWTLRVSVATIDTDGPFSSWSDVRRELCVLDGDGVILHWDDGRRVLLHAGDGPLCFDGGDAIRASVVGAPTRDLNLMTRGRTQASLSRFDGAPREQPWGCVVLRATTLLVDGQPVHAPAWSFVTLHGSHLVHASVDGLGWWIEREALA
jgi:environmental stress-induced protein Ves